MRRHNQAVRFLATLAVAAAGAADVCATVAARAVIVVQRPTLSSPRPTPSPAQSARATVTTPAPADPPGTKPMPAALSRPVADAPRNR